MADLSDVTAFVAELATRAVYPAVVVDGVSYPAGAVAPANANSVTGKCLSIREGWPLQAQLFEEIKAGTTRISVYPMPGATADVYQILNKPYAVAPAVHGVAATVTGNTVILSGVPGAQEYVSLVVDGARAYSRVAIGAPPTLASICAQLLGDVQADYPTASLAGSTLSIPPAASIVARIGAPVQMAQVTHRQRHSVMVTVWAPDPEQRAKVAEAVDVLFKATLTASLPDTSEIVLRYEKTNVTDEYEGVSIFRRDLVFGVEYATLEHFTGFEVTTISGTIEPGDIPGMPIAQPVG